MKLSVALCTFNGEKYIEEQLNSILNQTLAVDEIIICDDRSSDNTFTILNEYQCKYPTIIKCFKNEVNLKSNKNFEKAITLCNGDYIFFSDQDDIWERNKTEIILNIFLKNPILEGVFSDGKLINENGEKFSDDSLWDNIMFIERSLKKPIDLFKYGCNVRNMVTGGTLCIKSSTKNFILPFPDSKTIFHDEWIALNLSSRKTLSYTSEKLISYRVHGGQQIGVMNVSKKAENLKVIKCIMQLIETNDYKFLHKIYKSYFRNYIKFSKLKSNYLHAINFDLDKIILENKYKIVESEKKMKEANLILYRFNKLTDKLTGKRQF